MDQLQAEELLKKYNDGLASYREKILIENWFANEWKNMQPAWHPVDYTQVKKLMWQKINESTIRKKSPGIWPALAAAAILFVIVCATLFYFRTADTSLNQDSRFARDIAPGSSKAILRLSNGKTINLTERVTGELIKEPGVVITQSDSGQLVYQVVGADSGASDLRQNTIETPMGGQYTVILSEGSLVTLNAGSVLKYPASFSGKSTRTVELSGEGYFEISKDVVRPFIVKTTKQSVRVVGTRFNVSAYFDENQAKTTVVEGSVEVRPSVSAKGALLKPGQQSILDSQGIKVVSIPADEAVAWRNGLFFFDNEPLGSIMRKIARWYNVQIQFADDGLQTEEFWGSVSRFEKVSEVLKMLEQTGEVRFEIKRNTILIYRK